MRREYQTSYESSYLTFEIVEGGNLYWAARANIASYKKTIQYRKNGGSWSSITSDYSANAVRIPCSVGDIIEVKGNNDAYGGYSDFSGATCGFNLKGNILSLIHGDDFQNNTVLSGQNAFKSFFQYCTKLRDISKLILGGTDLKSNTYENMFVGCTGLVNGGALLSTENLSGSSAVYYAMFKDCSSLTIPPKISATIMGTYSCALMFYYCTNLTTPPDLPATTLAERCYYEMFYYCSKLTRTPLSLPATYIPSRAYSYMFYNCTSLTQTMTTLPATRVDSYGYASMFLFCEALVTGPSSLSLQVPGDYACYEMFSNCKSLTGATTINSLISGASYAFREMYKDCTSLKGGMPQIPNISNMGQYAFYLMFDGCTSLTSAPNLLPRNVAMYAYRGMFRGCTSLATTPALCATTISSGSFYDMFRGCGITTAPVLKITTVPDVAYNSMFFGCTKLTYVKCLATSLGTNSTQYWMVSTPSSGTFVKHTNMTGWTRDTNGIPTGWTVQNATS